MKRLERRGPGHIDAANLVQHIFGRPGKQPQLHLRRGIRLSLFIALPATFGLLLLAQPILSTLFQYGAFDESDTLMATLSLMAYSLGLPAFILIKILANAFYARQDSKTPVRIGIIGSTQGVNASNRPKPNIAVTTNQMGEPLIICAMRLCSDTGTEAAPPDAAAMALKSLTTSAAGSFTFITCV